MNQVESHPQQNQDQLIDFCTKHGIHVTAYSPLGAGTLLTNPTIVGIGKKHNKSAAQVMIRWQIQRGVIAIPKSTKKEYIKENIDVFDFELTDQDMSVLDKMNWMKSNKFENFLINSNIFASSYKQNGVYSHCSLSFANPSYNP